MNERLEGIKSDAFKNRISDVTRLMHGDVVWLIQQVERVEETVKRNKELEYASKYNGELNDFLQKRKLPPNTLGRHVVDVAMERVEVLEAQIKSQLKVIGHYEDENQRLLDIIADAKFAYELYYGDNGGHEEILKALAGEPNDKKTLD